VIVWWAGEAESDDVVSPCWPQDLYKVGEYDSDEGELWAEDEEDGDEGDDAEDGSEASWTTESEDEVEVDESAVFHNDEEDQKGKQTCLLSKLSNISGMTLIIRGEIKNKLHSINGSSGSGRRGFFTEEESKRSPFRITIFLSFLYNCCVASNFLCYWGPYYYPLQFSS
jgi:hypothetical protein